MPSDDERIRELTAIIETVRERVRTRYPAPANGEPADGRRVAVPVADLMPIVHARDAAQAKIASIGNVNPRSGGLVNKIIQAVKKTIARSLRWFVRDQVTFNRETISAIEAILEALNEHNRILVSLASQVNEQNQAVRAGFEQRMREFDSAHAAQSAEMARLRDAMAEVRSESAELRDIRKHWIEWRAEWERKLATNEIQFLRSAADLQGAFQHRSTQMESNFRDIAKSQHADYLGALDRYSLDIQKRLWADLEKIRAGYEHLIHTELRLLRRRGLMSAPSTEQSGEIQQAAAAPSLLNFDYGRFAERFRGSEEYVRANQQFYKPFFAECANVLDIGCGRGEFLETMRDLGVNARGIELSEESVAQCREKGLKAERADLFEYLAAQPDEEFDGIFSSQVVEHLPPERLPEMIMLCAGKLRRGGTMAIETPNPECLAIFATHFYLDPTHTRPVPHPLLAFYLEEAGCGQVEVHKLSPAMDSIPEVAELPANFRDRFFGGLDYAIIARRL